MTSSERSVFEPDPDAFRTPLDDETRPAQITGQNRYQRQAYSDARRRYHAASVSDMGKDYHRSMGPEGTHEGTNREDYDDDSMYWSRAPFAKGE
jgi:hypothetical protein